MLVVTQLFVICFKSIFNTFKNFFKLKCNNAIFELSWVERFLICPSLDKHFRFVLFYVHVHSPILYYKE